MSTPYDVLIIGGGPGGYVAAIRAAHAAGASETARKALGFEQLLIAQQLQRG